MALSKYKIAFAACALSLPAAAHASTTVEITYDFTGSYSCGAPSDAPEACEDAANNYEPNYSLSFSPTSPVVDAPDLEVFGGTFDPTLQRLEVSQFAGGLSVGDENSSGGSQIGSDETLFLSFLDGDVDLLEFEIRSFKNGQDGKVEDGGVFEFVYGAGDTPFDLRSDPDGEDFVDSLFRFTNVTPTGDDLASGYFLKSVTIGVEVHDDPEIIPVPPALPLLGGALGLMFWRARKAKKAA